MMLAAANIVPAGGVDARRGAARRGGRGHLVGIVAMAAALWIAGLGAYPLLESTEGRYAAIASAMVRDGDYLDPRFDGLLHLDKPPLAYWAGATALRLLPDGELAVRLPATLAWLLAAWLVVLVARAAGLDRRRAWWAAAFAALSPLAVSQAHMLGCDVFLWVGVLLFQLAMQRAGRSEANTAGVESADRRRAEFEPGRSAAGTAWMAGAGLGLGFMAKGPIVFLWTLLPGLVTSALARRRAALGPLGDARTWAVFAVLGLPWYVLEVVRHPGLAGYWLGHQTASRYLTTVHGRAEPWWYFLVLLPGIVLPWLPEAGRGIRRALPSLVELRHGRLASGTRSWLVAAFVPFLFLCFSGSKRPNYLLPMLAPLAWLAASALPEQRSRLARAWSGAWLVILLALPFLLASLPGAVPPTRALARAARREGGTLATFRVLPASLPFYWGQSVPAIEVPRDARFDAPEIAARWAPGDASALGTHVAGGGSVLLRARDEAAARVAAERPLRRIAAAVDLVLLAPAVPAPAVAR